TGHGEKDVTGDGLRISKHSEILSVLQKSRPTVKLGAALEKENGRSFGNGNHEIWGNFDNRRRPGGRESARQENPGDRRFGGHRCGDGEVAGRPRRIRGWSGAGFEESRSGNRAGA